MYSHTSIQSDLPQILLVDDEPRILRSLKAALKKHYKIITANNADEAKIMIENNNDLSVIVSDERMPGILGHELLAWSKLNRPEVTRILMTGYSDIKAIQNSINEAEIFKYVTKPWNIEELIQVIDKGVINVKSGLYFAHKSEQKHQSAECQLAVLNMVDSNDKIYTNVAKSLSKSPLIAHDIGSVFNLLANNSDIGVLFVDDDHTDDDTINLVAIIHEKYPSIVIIVATTAADGKGAIKLLNSGQIFRYLVKPLTETRLKPMLHAAIHRFEEKSNKHEKIKSDVEKDSIDSTLVKYWRRAISFWR